LNILFLTLSDFENIEGRGIYTDLMKEFVTNGHKVTIVSPRERKHGEPTRILKYNNYCILKVRIGNTQKTNMIERGFTTIFLQRRILSSVKKYLSNEKFDLILYSTPPVTFAKVIRYIKRRDNAASYLMLKDIFPQNAVDLGLFGKRSILYRYFRMKEENLYALSDFIGCMSDANVHYLKKNNPQIPEETIEVCPNSIIPVKYFPENKNEIRSKYNIPGNAVTFVYGGNLGKPQAMEYIIEVLKENTGKPDRHFIMCGSGTETYKLKRFIDNEKPQNVILINGLPKIEYDELISVCDVGLVFLDKRFTVPCFPSRMLSYMEYYLPTLAATDKNTDLGDIILEGKFGWWCESRNAEDFSKIVDDICSNRAVLRDKGNNARKYLENNYTTWHSYEKIIKHFK
jgi:glycosyltransferase involved in cell wall biosynthesis